MKLSKKDGRTLERRLMAKINNWDCFDGRSSHGIIVTLDSAVEDTVDLCAAYYQNVVSRLYTLTLPTLFTACHICIE